MAAWAAVVRRGWALYSRLVPTDCQGSQQTHQQVGNLRQCCTESTRMCNNSSSALKVTARGPSNLLSSQKEVSAITRNTPVPQGVAGIQAETSDELAGSRTGLSIGRVTIQGLREEMEDDAVVLDGPLGFTYAAIFDGHVGFSAVQFLRDGLYKDCIKSLDGGALLESDDDNAVEEALVRAFHQADRSLLSWLESNSEEKEAGSTATVLFMRNNSVTVAHVGDSRAVLSRGGKAVDLSADHRPFGNSKTSIAEINRVKKAGGWISHGRLCAMLSVSRAFGDVGFKTLKKEMLEEGIIQRRWTRPFAQKLNLDGTWLSVTPDVNRIMLEEDAEFIILATDGLWDSFKSNDAVQFIRKQLKQHGDAQKAAEAMAQATLERHGQDNISIIILDLGKVTQEETGIKLKWW